MRRRARPQPPLLLLVVVVALLTGAACAEQGKPKPQKEKLNATEVIRRLLEPPAPPPKEKEVVQFVIGEEQQNNPSRLLLGVHPGAPFVWTAYPDGMLSLSYLRKNIMTFGLVPETAKSSMPKTAGKAENATSNGNSTKTSNAEKTFNHANNGKSNKAALPLRFVEISKESLQDNRGAGKRSFGGNLLRRLSEKAADESDLESSLLELASSDEGADNKKDKAHGDSGANAASHSNATNSSKSNPGFDVTRARRSITRAGDSFVYVPDLAVVGQLRINDASPMIGSVPQWAVVSFDDFDVEPSEGYSEQHRAVCGPSEDRFLGGYCHLADQPVTKTLSDLPKHNQLKLQGRFHFFDNWRGEIAFAKIDNRVVWTQSHYECTSKFSGNCKGINVCGDDKYSDRLSFHFEATVQHSSPNVTLAFGSTLGPTPCLASYGIDDITVSVLRF